LRDVEFIYRGKNEGKILEGSKAATLIVYEPRTLNYHFNKMYNKKENSCQNNLYLFFLFKYDFWCVCFGGKLDAAASKKLEYPDLQNCGRTSIGARYLQI